jgi:hypothetical protein
MKKLEIVMALGIFALCVTGMSHTVHASLCPSGETYVGLMDDGNGNQIADCVVGDGSLCADGLCTFGSWGQSCQTQTQTISMQLTTGQDPASFAQYWCSYWYLGKPIVSATYSLVKSTSDGASYLVYCSFQVCQ